MSMLIKFYLDPLITTDHRVVRKSRLPYGYSTGAPSSAYSTATVPDFVPVWSGSMTLDIPRKVYSAGQDGKTAPNYAVIEYSAADALRLCYFVQWQNVTDETLTATFTVDWWGTYGNALKVTGTQTRGLDTGAFGIEPKYPLDTVMKMQPMGPLTFNGGDLDGMAVSRTYHVVTVVQCYYNEAWPVLPDGRPYQVTCISRIAFTVEDILGSGSHAEQFRAMMSPLCMGRPNAQHSTVQTVISVLRRQLIPADMIEGGSRPGKMFEPGNGYAWFALYGQIPQNDTEMQTVPHQEVLPYYAATGEFVDYPNVAPADYPKPHAIMWYDVKTRSDNEYTANDAAHRVFIGNAHTRFPLEDCHIRTGQVLKVATITLTLTINNGFTLELDMGDHTVDITSLFDAGVVYNTDQEMKYAAGDSHQLGVIAGALSSTVSIGAGVGKLAAGDVVGGVLSMGGGARNLVNTIAGSQFRGKQYVSGGDTTAISDVGTDLSIISPKAGYGLFNFVTVQLINGEERAHDRNMNGYVLFWPRFRSGVVISTLPSLAGSVEDPNSPPTRVPFRIADPVVSVQTITASSSAQQQCIIPTPTDEIIVEAEGDLSRGILAIDDNVTTLT